MIVRKGIKFKEGDSVLVKGQPEGMKPSNSVYQVGEIIDGQ